MPPMMISLSLTSAAHSAACPTKDAQTVRSLTYLYGLNDTGWAKDRVPVYAVIWPVKEPLIVPVLIENVAEELPARTVTVAGMIR